MNTFYFIKAHNAHINNDPFLAFQVVSCNDFVKTCTGMCEGPISGMGEKFSLIKLDLPLDNHE